MGMHIFKEILNVSRKVSFEFECINYFIFESFFIFKGKVQKHQAFEAEIAANEDRVTGVINVGKGI